MKNDAISLLLQYAIKLEEVVFIPAPKPRSSPYTLRESFRKT